MVAFPPEKLIILNSYNQKRPYPVADRGAFVVLQCYNLQFYLTQHFFLSKNTPRGIKDGRAFQVDNPAIRPGLNVGINDVPILKFLRTKIVPDRLFLKP